MLAQSTIMNFSWASFSAGDFERIAESQKEGKTNARLSFPPIVAVLIPVHNNTKFL